MALILKSKGFTFNIPLFFWTNKILTMIHKLDYSAEQKILNFSNDKVFLIIL